MDDSIAQLPAPGVVGLPEIGGEGTGGRRWVLSFREGAGRSRELLGGKGAGLAEMTTIGLPVPPGFTITTDASREYQQTGLLPGDLLREVRSAMTELEVSTGRRFGDPANPLLVSVRSGASVSMPGMMDTILNLGINEDVARGIAARTGLPRFALDTYRRFVEMFGKVAMGVETRLFDEVSAGLRRRVGLATDAELPLDLMPELISAYRGAIEESAGRAVPDDPHTQLEIAISGVFGSWNGRRAIDYRSYHGISHDLGTAVNVVSMVFGNTDNDSATGVLFTRNPATGERSLYGEYLVNAQGEDVVAGTTTPTDLGGLADEMPSEYAGLENAAARLEGHYGDAQDIEFTVEQGRLYILQTRSAKRSPRAAVKMAVDMANEGLITRDEALLRIDPEQLYQLMLPVIDPTARDRAIADGGLLSTGVGASQGAATGRAVFSADDAVEAKERGYDAILVRPETRPEDVHGILAAVGIITSRGGATSHAAVVARGLGKPCVTGAESLHVDAEAGLLRYNGHTVQNGDLLTINGGTGEIFLGALETIKPRAADNPEMKTLLDWADAARRLGVWANADSAADAATALDMGAEGIGLCRTEHMFLEPSRLELMRELILAAHTSDGSEDEEAGSAFESALQSVEEVQAADFEAILRTMGTRPVVIRLLDPPLHEFLPDYAELAAEVAELERQGGTSPELAGKRRTLEAVSDLREVNPMLGMRGSRLGLMHPSIYEMQVRAIVRGAKRVSADGTTPDPEIMLPLIADVGEMQLLRGRLEKVIGELGEQLGGPAVYKIGTMIELPRAALTADKIADFADFFSFGTNDLTQTTYGFSRDDAEGKFLMRYVEEGIIPEDPFKVLDREGVGRLIKTGYGLGKGRKPGLQIGVCGEHGGDSSSIEFFHDVGLDYVSCSPYRVPIARLAAAQAAVCSAANS